MNHFCTLFDSHYLTRGLALYHSLVKTGADFHLFVFCFDDLSFEILTELKLEKMTLIELKKFETPELLKVKPGRTRGEYCWTTTSFTISHVLRNFNVPEITYLDADLFFFQNPEILMDEFRKSGKSILLTEHNYSPEYDNSKWSGKYCVQFMTFKNDKKALTALEWWKAKCLEWCFARVEDGKFGDQKYLDDWTTRFEGVHVLNHIGGGVAPWNIQKYRLSEGPSVDGIPVVFYHFHGLKWLAHGKFDLAEHRLPAKAINLIYSSYMEALKDTLTQVQKIKPDFNKGKVSAAKGFRFLTQHLKRRLKGTANIIAE